MRIRKARIIPLQGYFNDNDTNRTSDNNSDSDKSSSTSRCSASGVYAKLAH
jgi:hypothetical protein